MRTLETSIIVEKSVHAVYNQWTRFEEFPHFMNTVRSVQQVCDRRVHWKVGIAGVTRSWLAEIIEQVPDSRIVWRSVEGWANSGSATFSPIDDARTCIALRMHYQPHGLMEELLDSTGLLSLLITRSLRRFKDHAESRRLPLQGWRGEIKEGKVRAMDIDAPVILGI